MFKFDKGVGEETQAFSNAEYNHRWMNGTEYAGKKLTVEDLLKINWSQFNEKPFIFYLNTRGSFSPVKMWDELKRLLSHELTHFFNRQNMSDEYKEKAGYQRIAGQLAG